jgi:hypothetical protein
MKKLLPLAVLVCACQSHLIPRVQWTTLNGYKPNKPVLLEAEDGMFYLTPKANLAFVRKDGREINRRWQEITLAKNEFTAISVDREVFTFRLSDLEKIVAYGKLAGEITGVVPDTGPRPGPGGPASGMRPMY